MLNPHTSGGDRWNDEAVPVTHEKSMVVVSLLVCLQLPHTRIAPLWVMAVAAGLGAFGLINR